MTSIQHGLLRNTLGLHKRKSVNQNCIATGESEDTYSDIRQLVADGFMKEGAKIPGGLTYYHATDAGVAAARLEYEECAALLAVVYPEPVTAQSSAPWEEE